VELADSVSGHLIAQSSVLLNLERSGRRYLAMRQPIEVAADSGNTVTVLSVTPYEEDQFCLQNIISHSTWKLYRADRLQCALAVLREHEVGVILSENHLPPHSWTDMLDVIHHLEDAPEVIVTSRLADDRLWAEALNLGAYDVLAKPFNQDEVLRSVSLAWLNWHRRHEIVTGLTKVMRAT
jgi:DNA-binding NtrC family response regulator